MSKGEKYDPHSNQLLGALEVANRKRIEPHLEPIQLKLGDVVCEAGGLLKHAYFPQGDRSLVTNRFGGRLRNRDCKHRARRSIWSFRCHVQPHFI